MTPSRPAVPGYEIVDLVGRGGFGVVYRARQVTIDREVAVKIDNRMIVDDRDRHRFLREARAAGRLSGHPHVVDLYDAGVLPDGRPYLVMELCIGGSLLDRLRQSGSMHWREACTLGAKIGDALAAAHAVGVLHRDIKPANILVNRYGVYGLADFGLASLAEPERESSTNLLALTPAYSAPEEFRQQPSTERSDIYSLGATVYALISGRPPRFPPTGDPSLAEIILMHDQPLPAIPGVPDAAMAVLATALATEPSARHATAAEFRDALTALDNLALELDDATTISQEPTDIPTTDNQLDDHDTGENTEPADPPDPSGRTRRRGQAKLFDRSSQIVLSLFSVGVLTVVGISWAVLASLNDAVGSLDILDLPNSPGGADGATDVLLVGNDSRTDTDGNPLPDDVLKVLCTEQKPGANTDTIIIARIPDDGRPASVVAIPSAIPISFRNGTTTTLDRAFATGKQQAETEMRSKGITDENQIARDSDTSGRRQLVQSIQELTGVRIDHYAEINLYGFYLISNAIGGVDICLNAAVADPDSGANFTAGNHTISGADALSFVRQRHGLPHGELDRITRQQAFLSSLLDKILSTHTLTNPTTIKDLVRTLRITMTTDANWNILEFIQKMSYLTSGEVRFVTIPTTNTNSTIAIDPNSAKSFMRDLTTSPPTTRNSQRPNPAPSSPQRPDNPDPTTTTRDTSTATTPAAQGTSIANNIACVN